MTSLQDQVPSDSYGDLLQVSNAGSGIDSTLRAIADGENTGSQLFISTTGVQIGATGTLSFASGATVNFANATVNNLSISSITHSALYQINLDTDVSSGNAVEIKGAAAGQLTGSSGVQAHLSLQPDINQSGTAGYIGFEIDVTETATGSGTNLIQDLKVGGTSKLSFDNGGSVRIIDAQGIKDDSGNEQLIFQKTASAVNHLEVTNAATGGNPLLAAAGDDANVDLNIGGKATGKLAIVDGADNTKRLLHDVSGITTATDRTVTWPDTDVNLGAASETVVGRIEIATQTEADTGTDDTRAITPLKLFHLSGNFKAINAQTGTTYTAVASDAGKLITMDNASANTLNINDSVFAANDVIYVMQKGAGATTIAGSASNNVNSADTLVLDGQWAMAEIIILQGGATTTSVVFGKLVAA